MDITRKESVKLSYKDDKITFVGDTFNGVLSISSEQLQNLYFGNPGRGILKLNVEIPDEKKETPPPTVTPTVAEVKPFSGAPEIKKL